VVITLRLGFHAHFWIARFIRVSAQVAAVVARCHDDRPDVIVRIEPEPPEHDAGEASGAVFGGWMPILRPFGSSTAA
jgi:hypothetical protein